MEIRSSTPGGRLHLGDSDATGTASGPPLADFEIADYCGDDALKWAQEFTKVVNRDPNVAKSEDTMVGWFANAIEAADRTRHEQTGPQVTFFPTEGTKPHVNTDVRIRISLNGKLIAIERGIDEDGKGGTTGGELYGVNWHEFDNLIGRLLTLCDATFTDPVQRKAFKDMVRQHVKEWVTAIVVDAAADAGMARNLTAPFVGGVLDQPGGLFGVEGEPTP